MEKTKHKKPRVEVSYFANLNKNNTMEEYECEVSKGDYTKQEVNVVMTITTNILEFEGLKNTFLHDFPEIWEKVGGSHLNPEAEKVNPVVWKRIHDMKEFTEMYSDEEALEFFRENSRLNVVEVVCEDAKTDGRDDQRFFVDTQGFDYARYVGVSEERYNKLMFWNERDSLNKQELEAEEYYTQLAELEDKWKQEKNSIRRLCK